MSTPSNWSLLSAHHLIYQVQALLERAESHAVLVTPYIDLWPSLELVMRQTVARGAALHVVTRSKDETHFEKHEGRRTSSLDRIKALGATLHEVDWLHTKLYLSEKEAIVSSFNLTPTGRDGPNLGVHLHGAEAATQALQQVDQWLPGFSGEVGARSADCTKDTNAIGGKPSANAKSPDGTLGEHVKTGQSGTGQNRPVACRGRQLCSSRRW